VSIFFWKNNKVIDELAASLAEDLYNTVNPKSFDKFFADEKANKKLDKNVKRAIGNVIVRIKDYRKDNKMGVYAKARFHLKFKNRLYELGYSDDVVEDVDKLIMVETP